jgi:hypothetical protein
MPRERVAHVRDEATGDHEEVDGHERNLAFTALQHERARP